MTRLTLAAMPSLLLASALSAQVAQPPVPVDPISTRWIGGVAAEGARRIVLLGRPTEMYVVRSEDFGRSWSTPLRIDDGTSRATFTGNTDNDCVYLHGQHVYAIWAERNPAGYATWFGRSTDGGSSFTATPLAYPNPPGLETVRIHMVVEPSPDDPTQDVIHVLEALGSRVYERVQLLRLATSTDGGASLGNPVPVAAPSGSLQSYFMNFALRSEGSRVLVAWIDEGVHLARSLDGGATFGPPLRLDSAGTGVWLAATVSMDVEGDFVAVTWTLNTTLQPSLFSRVSEDGGASFRPQVPLGDASTTRVTAEEARVRICGERIAVSWAGKDSAGTGFHGLLSTDRGLSFQEVFFHQDFYPLQHRLVAEGTRLAFAWSDYVGGDQNVLSTFSLDAGTTWSAPVRLNPGQPLGAAMALALGDGDDVVALWAGQPIGVSRGIAYAGGCHTTAATVVHRTAGTNVDSYVAAPPVIGAPWSASVDLSLTGHDFAVIQLHAQPVSVPLASGAVVLAGGPRVWRSPFLPGPLATLQAIVPDDLALSGYTLYSQAAHLLGVTPFTLTNAQDLVHGTF